MSKQIYVIAGPNGAGKTTFAKTFLPDFADCKEFVNADMIATGLSPFSPDKAAMQAGRLVLKRIRELAEVGISFGFESTLSGKTYTTLFRTFRKRGYHIHGVYLWLPEVELAIQRVKDRVRLGGHSVPEVDIRRRFSRGVHHFLTIYQSFWETWGLFDNSGESPIKIAYGSGQRRNIVHPDSFQAILKQAGLV